MTGRAKDNIKQNSHVIELAGARLAELLDDPEKKKLVAIMAEMADTNRRTVMQLEDIQELFETSIKRQLGCK